MKKAFVFFFVSIISSFSFAQTEPQLLNPVAHKLENTRYIGSPLSLDGYIKTNKAECTTRVATQMLKLNNEKNKDFINYTKAIGHKLKQIDDRCNYFRFELIDYTEDGGMDMRFAWRCYATATGTLPHQRVSHLDPFVINPAVFYKDENLVAEKCDALAITKHFAAMPAKSMKSGSTSSSQADWPKSNLPSPSKLKKGSGQN
ncbi:MAG: hypothetical protein H7235_12290 [Bdellovibrionaceae bacterium]|nr:hypothetical protein [Pseudobdellovibrionaceae bacterium]